MPAHQLPWFKVWKGFTAHHKARQLSDPVFRTWIELLDAASQQPSRGRFDSRKAAAAVVRRPLPHIGTLIDVGLIDEAPSKGLTMHDWDAWQRWQKEDANDTGTTQEAPTEGPPEALVNDTRTTTATTREAPKIEISPPPSCTSPLPLGRGEKRDVRRETIDTPAGGRPAVTRARSFSNAELLEAALSA